LRHGASILLERTVTAAKQGFVIALAVAHAMIGCGEFSPDSAEADGEASPPVYDVVKIDSIGLEMGDSNYVFATIIDAATLSDGRIAVLDILRRKVLVYSGEGQFLGSAGREGMGPGELISPMSLAPLTNGGFAVADVQQGKIVFFDSSMQYERELSGFQPMVPHILDAGPGSAVSGKRVSGKRMSWYYDEDAQELMSGTEYGRWSDSVEADLIYMEDYHLQSSDDQVSYNFCSTPDGRFFCTPSSHTVYEITGYGPAGDTLFDVEVPWTLTRVTQEELDVARPYLIIPGPGSEATSEELSADWVPDSIRNTAYIIGFDAEERLWVASGRGTDPTPVFDLFSMTDGSRLMSIETTLPAIARYWSYAINDQGVLAWDQNPSDYPRLYILGVISRDN
jgi:hypothetical protein